MAFFLAVGLSFATASQAATLDKVRETSGLKLGFRDDAAPFSFADENGRAAGYSVALCAAIGGAVQASLELDQLAVEFVPVTAENRFAALADGRIDLLCGATTVTLQRRAEVDFSLQTFVTGASVLYRSGGPASFTELNGRKVGVRAGTTTDDGLRRALSEAGITAEVVAISSHEAGRDALEAEEIAAYFADRAILIMLARQAKNPERLVLSQRFFSFEPYALALRRGDSDFRLLVDRALVRLYRSKAIGKIYEASFGKARMSDLLRAMYTLQSFPD
ncbi:amino acid ABC transporter substrate-binding protein [Pelagibius litoralis]|uniref:Amino acid ABC transporter substrate-binding protein n=1 Tax=Pelagibius litoralis TaxID=374515 RepID=A0A967F0L0_9PROT|nr:amino acid ABC transporter substrate-binding protein [Pelagibius litoralis]NIA70791.1 amino acid ABC transporter substrate-binding protein [Pelagibius litoralis]